MALAVVAIMYQKLTFLKTVFTYDRVTDRATPSVIGRKDSEEWDLGQSDLEGSEVSEIRGGLTPINGIAQQSG